MGFEELVEVEEEDDEGTKFRERGEREKKNKA